MACVAAAIAAAGGFLVAKRAGGRPDRAALSTRAVAGAPPPDPFEGLPVALGDVVSADGEERWLAGAIVLREGGRVVAALLTAPEGAKLHAVVAFPPPGRAIFWLAPADVAVPADPPTTIELGGVALHRRSRRPVEVERLGTGAPDVGASATFATYDGGARDVAVVLAGRGQPLTWVGRRRDDGEYERMGAGGDG